MTYILMIWSVVAMAGDRFHQAKAYDWRPISEFHSNGNGESRADVHAKCESAAKQLGLKTENYRCVRSK